MKTKQLLAVLLSAMLLLGALAPLAAAAPPQDGPNGKFLAPIDSPAAGSIPIATRAELEKIGNDPSYPLDGKFHLTADIDLAGQDWAPLARTEERDIHGKVPGAFLGTFDGQGHIIKNLTITGEGYENNGLFGIVHGDALVIKNVGMEDTNINLANDSNVPGYRSLRAGGICGQTLGGTISNCYNTGSIYGNSVFMAGGIVGYVTSDNTITREAIISDCYNTANITTVEAARSSTNAGGIAGSVGAVAISRCFNTGNITATAPSICHSGGIVGVGSSSTAIIDCYNAGDITGVYGALICEVGGIAGNDQGGMGALVQSSYTSGALSASSDQNARLGGICGITPRIQGSCYWNIDSGQTVNGVALQNSEKKGVGYPQQTGGGIFPLGPTPDEIKASVTALTSAQMQNQNSFAGFDFGSVWTMPASGSYLYPVFKSQVPDPDTNPTTFTISYHANSGVDAPAAQTKTLGIDLTLSMDEPTRAGYTFLGWAGSPTAATPVYQPGDTFTVDANTTLYAVWKGPATHLLRFFDGIDDEPMVYTAREGSTFNFNIVLQMSPPAPPAHPDLCEFLGWSLVSGAHPADYAPNGSMLVDRGYDFYAVWAFKGATSTGTVTVSPTGAFEPGTAMLVQEWGSTTYIGIPGGKLYYNLISYDITFSGYTSADYPLSSPVTVRISIPDDYAGDINALAVKHISPSGSIYEDVASRAVQIGGKWYIEFETDHFSIYAIVYEVQGDDSKPNPPTAPDWNGKSQTFTYKKGNAFTLALPQGVAVKEWKSSNTKTAAVANGKVTLGRRGTATITAVIDDNTAWTYKVTVKYNFWQWLLFIICFGWIWM